MSAWSSTDVKNVVGNICNNTTACYGSLCYLRDYSSSLNKNDHIEILKLAIIECDYSGNVNYHCKFARKLHDDMTFIHGNVAFLISILLGILFLIFLMNLSGI